MYPVKLTQVVLVEQEIYFVDEIKLQFLLNQDNLFSPDEKNYCLKKPTPLLSVAGLWCAKQAFIKATNKMGFFDFNYLDLEIRHSFNGQPKILLKNTLAQQFRKQSINVEVTISHTKMLAVASVLFWRCM
jgi:phosphopantetheine--protein transferase-like protein